METGDAIEAWDAKPEVTASPKGNRHLGSSRSTMAEPHKRRFPIALGCDGQNASYSHTLAPVDYSQISAPNDTGYAGQELT